MDRVSSILSSAELNPVRSFVERLRPKIEAFQQALDADRPGQSIRATAILQGGREITATYFGYHGPDMLVIHGIDEQGRPCRVLAFYGAVQILLAAVSAEREKERPAIGFQSGTASPEPNNSTVP